LIDQERDEHIQRLKERLKILSKKLSQAKEGQSQAKVRTNDHNYATHYLIKAAPDAENGAELASIIKQVTKERLQLERHLQIANDSLQRGEGSGVDLHKFLTLEQTNNQLRQQLDSLDTIQVL